MGALRAAFRGALVAFDRFDDLDEDFDVAAGFRFASGFAEVFFADRAPERLPGPGDALRRAAFAALRAVFRTGLRPLERPGVRELFRAAFLVPPAALRLAITAPFLATLSRSSVPGNPRLLTLTVTGK